MEYKTIYFDLGPIFLVLYQCIAMHVEVPSFWDHQMGA